MFAMVLSVHFCGVFIRLILSLLVSGVLLWGSACLVRGADPSPRNDLAMQVQNHLDAGEFGLALSLAKTSPTPAEHSELLHQIANAQQASGDIESANGTRRRIPRNDRAAKTPFSRNDLAGGSQANFGPLMMLIRQNIRGDYVKWFPQDEDGGSMTPFIMGVRVSADVLTTEKELSDRLSAQGIRARQADLNEDVSRKCSLRMVSLTRLEREVSRRIEEGLPVPETMSKLAGLSQVNYLFVYPENHEIVLAGPAGGWNYNHRGQAVSITDGRPILQLDDLVTVLRTFARGESDFGCSINTRDAGAKELKEFVEQSQASGPVKNTTGWVKQLQKKLGRQDVVVWGVPAESRVAQVIFEADYRMKLIGIDKLDAGKEIPSYFDLLGTAPIKDLSSIDALRWWLTMQTAGAHHSADKCAFEILETSVLCQSENQFLTAEGKHVPAGKTEEMNRQFAQNFTHHFAKLASRDLVFADLINIFNLAHCSALIKRENLAERAGWDWGVFAPNGAYLAAVCPVPKEIESVVNHRIYQRGSIRDVVVQVAGGVHSNAMSAARDPQRNTIDPQLENFGSGAKAPELPVGRWWWDSAN
jgi:hypothetical protein